MTKEFKYRLNKKSKRLTFAFLILATSIIIACNYFSISGFFPAWVISLLVTVGALYILSIPKYIRITENDLEIHCVIELTKISIKDIKSVRLLEKKDMKHTVPLLGSYGFFGFYGYFIDFSRMSLVKMYASSWDNFIMIEDIYEDIYIVNCNEPEELVTLLEDNKERLMIAEEIKSADETLAVF